MEFNTNIEIFILINYYLYKNKIMIKLKIDGKEYEVEDSVASFVNSKTAEATTLQAKNDALESKIKTINADMKSQIDSIVKQTIEVREVANKIGLEKFDTMDNESIKKSIIIKAYKYDKNTN